MRARSAKLTTSDAGGPVARRPATLRILLPGVAVAGLAALAMAILVFALLGLTILALLPGVAHAGSAVGAGTGWEAAYAGPAGSQYPDARAVAVGSDGSVYVAGIAGPETIVHWLLKYDTAGNVLWQHGPWESSAREAQAVGLTTMPLGVLVWGSCGSQIRVARYGTGGDRLWETTIKGTTSPGGTSPGGLPHAVAVDRTRHIYVAGSLGVRSGLTARLVKLGPGGRVFWRLSGPAGEFEAVQIGVHGNVFVCGRVMQGSRSRGLLASYGPSGAKRWSLIDPRVGFTKLVVAASGRVYVCGGVRVSPTHALAIVRAYSPSGRLLWGRRVQVTAGCSARFATLTLDAAGGVVCAGTTDSTDAPLGWGDAPADFLVARFTADGTRTLLDTWAGESGVEEDEVVGVECPASGGFLVGGDSLRYEGTSRLVVIPYDASGTRGEPLTHETAGSFEEAHASALTPTGPVVVGTSDDAAGRQALTVQFAYGA